MCGYPIDQTLNRGAPGQKRHPLASVVDEWIPRNPCKRRHCRHGCQPTQPGDVSLANCVELHAACNALKHNHWPVTDDLRAECLLRVEALKGRPLIRPV